MKKLSSLSAILLAMAGTAGIASCGSSTDDPPPAPGGSGGTGGVDDLPDDDDRRLVVLFTSDEHSHQFAFSPERDDWPLAEAAGTGSLVGGIARRATVLSRERKAAADAGKATITLSSGDNQMGALPHIAFESASLDYRALHALGYDATTLGNHEFDLGPKALANAISKAKEAGEIPAIVASNLFFSDEDDRDDELAALFGDSDDKPIRPYRVLTASNGLKIGLVGYMGVNASHVAKDKAPVMFSERALEEGQDPSDADLVLPKLYADLQPIVDKLRDDESVDIVIAMSHAGIVDPKNPESGEDYRIAANVSGIDLIISGHEHSDDAEPIVVKNEASGRDVVILNGSSYGRHVGRIEIVVPEDGSQPISFDFDSHALLPITDKELPDMAFAPNLEAMVASVEAAGKVDGVSYLERLLSRVEGEPITASDKPGSLYFHTIAETGFDLPKAHGLLALTADAMLAAVQDIAPTQISVQSNGVVRAGLLKGATGNISAADAFAVLPLGKSPKDDSLGFPLVRAHLNAFFIRAVFEFASARGPTNSQFDLIPGGLLVEYDCARDPVQSQFDLLDSKKGRVMRMSIDTDPSDGYEQFDRVIYDRNDSSQNAPNTELFSVITSSYIAEFAGDVGADLLDEMGEKTTIEESIVYRADDSELKEIEGFMSYLKANETVPSRYDANSGDASARLEKMKLCK